jgi:hypothetical protein
MKLRPIKSQAMLRKVRRMLIQHDRRCDGLLALRSLECVSATVEDVLRAVWADNRVPREDVGELVMMLLCRCRRGKTTLADAISLYVRVRGML